MKGFVGVTVGLAVLVLGFQNCSKARFSVDDALKAQALQDSGVLDGGIDPATVNNGNDSGIDPNTGMPGDNDGGKDPAIGSDKLFMSADLLCPVLKAHPVNKIFANSAAEVKIVFATMSGSQATSICEVHNVKQQIMKRYDDLARRIDISSCEAALTAAKKSRVNVYVVEESVTSDYAKYKFNEDPVSYDPVRRSITIIYADQNDKVNQPKCDQTGDPLLLQLNTSSPKPVELSSAGKGVMFDLLGRSNNHEKVQTAWFTSADSENYFLVLPDENGQVNGIDQLFGDNTFGPDKRYSKQGFQALAKHDDNGDRVIDQADEVFSKLKLWKDSNLDGVAQESELSSLADKHVALIDLRYDKRYKEVDRNGNMIKFKSIVIMEDESYGLVYDLWLSYLRK
jgi:hypothetical protein